MIFIKFLNNAFTISRYIQVQALRSQSMTGSYLIWPFTAVINDQASPHISEYMGRVMPSLIRTLTLN